MCAGRPKQARRCSYATSTNLVMGRCYGGPAASASKTQAQPGLESRKVYWRCAGADSPARAASYPGVCGPWRAHFTAPRNAGLSFLATLAGLSASAHKVVLAGARRVMNDLVSSV